MTREEAIQNAYGEYWEMVKDYVDKNGWCKIYEKSTFKELNGYDKDNSNEINWRPKKLEGVETNNNWIKIEGEGDLPKEDYVYWVMRKILNVPLYRQVELWSDEEKEYWMKNFSHYQKIKKPKPPIY